MCSRLQSSTVLRKVRLGQSLDTALHCKPLLQSHLKQPRDSSLTLVPFPICFRRERNLDPIQILPVSRARQSCSVSTLKNAPRTPNLSPSTEIPKERDDSDPSKSDDDNRNSDDSPKASKSAPDHHNAALIIARFFRSVCRLDTAADRAREVLRRRWREQHPEKYRTPVFELTNNEQLRVLQLYNPHLYGSQKLTLPLATTSTSTRLSRVPQMEQHKRLRRLEILTRMNRETALLNETSKQKTQAPASTTTTLHKAYQRQTLGLQKRPKTVLGRERLLQTRDLIMFPRTPPNFRYKTPPEARLLMTHTLKSVSTLQPLDRPK